MSKIIEKCVIESCDRGTRNFIKKILRYDYYKRKKELEKEITQLEKKKAEPNSKKMNISSVHLTGYKGGWRG